MNNKWSKMSLFLIINSFILPIITASFLVLFAQSQGCVLVGEESSQCLAFGLNLGMIIEKLIQITWHFPLMMSPQGIVPAFIAIAIIVIFIHLTLRGRQQFFLSLFCIWFIPIVPSVLGILLVNYLANQGNCVLNEGNANPCMVLGVDMGEAFSGASVVPWLILLLVPICLFISLFYMIIYALVLAMIREQSS
ncbi:hypothetical protein ACL6C3_27005 [Capilliphycus salinus ALCB114379]|uniref:hypothetical protein n=1 Tax=Capilliphycus salinus TaxID=2768948 RepID=UPI0039A4222D